MKPLSTIGRILGLVLLMAVALPVGAQHYVAIDGEVDTVMVLPRLGADSTYLVNNALTVTESGQLIVEAGVRIYFGQSACLRVDGGSLQMNGTATDSICLYCYEFSHDWAGVQLKNATEADSIRFSYVYVVGAVTALDVSNCMNVSVKHCTFNNYYAGKGVAIVDCSNFDIDSCFFDNCVSGVELKARVAHSENNRIAHSIFDKGQINIEVSNVGYGYKCNNTVISDNCFQGATTAISFESVGGLSDTDAVNYILNNVISSELPEGGSGYTSYGVKAAMDSLVIRNNIFWSNDEAITMLRVCHFVVEDNTFYDNKLVVTNLLASGSMAFTGNVISEAQKRIASFPSGLSRLNGNNFMKCNFSTTLFANVSSDDIDMRDNFWDTDDIDVIESAIIDKHDSPALGEVLIDGYLSECLTEVPVAPPYMVKKQFVDGQWLISWEDNQERDFDHYVLFYGDFDHYKFTKHIDSIFDTSITLAVQQAGMIAVAACDHAFDFDVYASTGQSAYAFASYYPYAGPDAELCEPQTGFALENANIPYTYNRFVWRTSGTGVFSDSLSLSPVYYPSAEDFEAGSVTLSLHVTCLGETKTDAMQLEFRQQLEVYAGGDSFSDLDQPVTLSEAWAVNYDSIAWHSLRDGHFDDFHVLNTVYYPGPQDIALGCVDLVLEAWSYCSYAADTVHFDLSEVFSLQGTVWADGRPYSHAQVIAVSVDDNPFFSGFYRTVSDEEGRFRFNTLLPDTYILYALPDTLDMTASGCYYLGDYQWNESNMILVDGDVFDVDITLPLVLQGFAVGQGRIGGVFDYPDTGFRAGDFYCQSWLRDTGDTEFCNGGLSNVGVLLLNAAKQRVLGFALTDDQGLFQFGNLPFGTYYVMADVPRYGRGLCEEVVLSPSQPTIDGLHLCIDDRGHVALRPNGMQQQVQPLSIYPNPTENTLIVTGLEINENYMITVTDMLGNLMMCQTVVGSNLLGLCQIEVGNLRQGLYFLTVKGASGSWMVKFVKR